MFILGLTGPTGSGKSTVAAILKKAGFEIVDADFYARVAVQPGSRCLEELAASFGKEILAPDGSLDRKRLAAAAFSDEAGVERLNAITHPHIFRLIRERLEELEKSGCQRALLDAPALYESGADSLCDMVAAIIAPEEIRVERILRRDGMTETEARRRVYAQPPVSFYTARADFTILNRGDFKELEKAAGELLVGCQSDSSAGGFRRPR